jgi:basic membrane protein A
MKMSIRKTAFALAAAMVAVSAAPAFAFLACAVTDTGGVDDKGFNQYTWQGVQDAAKAGGFDAKVLESKSDADYVPNLQSFVDAKCDVIVTVGFLLGDATKDAATANPNIKYTIVDYAYDPTIPNVLGQVYATNQGGFLAGYLAAGLTKSGTVGTFGGINIGGPVTDFMDGFVWGVDYYNKAKSKTVKVLGWDPAKKDGVFVGDFTSIDKGKDIAKSMMDEGADIILPVAGKVGQGPAALAAEVGADKLKVIGVDTDQYATDPDHKSVYLTSIMKRVDSTTNEAVTEAFKGTFKGGVIVGDLKSGGVALAPFHDFDSAIPADLKAELDKLKAGIIDGSIKVGPAS